MKEKQLISFILSGIFFVASFSNAYGVKPNDNGDYISFNEDEIWFKIPRQGNTVSDALKNSSIRFAADDLLSPSAETPLKSVNSIFLSRQKKVSIVVGNEKPVSVTAYRASVGELIKKVGINLSVIDIVSPDRKMAVRDGEKIVVTRVFEKEITEEEINEPAIKRRDDKELPLGEEKIIAEGKPEIIEYSVRVRTENGVETSRKILNKIVKQEMEPKIVMVGTKVVVLGIETGRASWYNYLSSSAAHLSLPFGTKLRVTNKENNKSTIVKVADRGPYVAGRIVDLSSDAFKKLAPLGQGTIPVTVEILK